MIFDILYSIFYILIWSQLSLNGTPGTPSPWNITCHCAPRSFFCWLEWQTNYLPWAPRNCWKTMTCDTPPHWLTSLTIGKKQKTTTNGPSVKLCWIKLNPCPAPAKLTRLLEDLGRRAVRHGVLAITWRPLSQQYFKGWSGRTDLGVAGNLGRSYQLPRWQGQRCNSLKNCYWFIIIPIIPLQLLPISGYTLHFSDKPDHFGWNTVCLYVFIRSSTSFQEPRGPLGLWAALQTTTCSTAFALQLSPPSWQCTSKGEERNHGGIHQTYWDNTGWGPRGFPRSDAWFSWLNELWFMVDINDITIYIYNYSIHGGHNGL